MTTHPQPHPLAGQTVKLRLSSLEYDGWDIASGDLFQVEDYWDRLTGGSWLYANGNPACLDYAVRLACSGLPLDDEVVYGKVRGLGYLVHVTELDAPSEAVTR